MRVANVANSPSSPLCTPLSCLSNSTTHKQLQSAMPNSLIPSLLARRLIMQGTSVVGERHPCAPPPHWAFHIPTLLQT